MQPRVTAILVARNGAEYLEHTLDALGTQTRQPDAVIFVDSGSTDSSISLLADARPTHLVIDSSRRGFGSAVAKGLRAAPPAESDDDWIWLLAHDSAPHSRALANLLGAVEIAPSVAIAGPKLMRWDRPDTIAAYGDTMTRFGTSVALVENELDQAQHDHGSDLLGVAASGMLVRRSVWLELGGFDSALPSVDAALDFAVRVRLAGHRVVGVPGARVLTVGSPELFGRKSMSGSARASLRRAAQLHRRLVYAPSAVLPLHWLSLLPLAVLRSILHLIRKHPASIGGEFRTAIHAALTRSVGESRRNLRRTKKVGWSAIAPLRVSIADARELRAQQWETTIVTRAAPTRTRVGFFSGGGAWSVLLAALIGIIAFSPLLGAEALAGGGLAPLSGTIGEVWSQVGYGWHQAGGGFVGASDPFTALLALIASLTYWAPSLSIVVLYLIALPLAALGAWWAAVRLTERAWPPAIAALLWSLAPPLLSSMINGELGAVLAHLLLPWLMAAVLNAGRSWSSAAAAALMFAGVAASAPILIPALVLGWLALMVARPRRIPRLFGLVIPAVALFAPLVVEQVSRGNVLGWLAQPGVPVAASAASGWQLALGVPDANLNGWVAAGEMFGFADVAGPVILAVLLAPLALLALLALFLPGSRRSVPALFLALLGFLTAVLSTRLEITFVGSEAIAIWPGAGLSLFWLGLTAAVVISLDALARSAALPALVVALASVLAAGPLLAAPLAGAALVGPSRVDTLPAFVSAEAVADPQLGTLQLDPQPDGGLAITLHRGSGTTLDEQSTLVTTSTAPAAAQASLARLVGNLSSESGLDIAAEMNSAHIGFVLLREAAPGDTGAGDAGAGDAGDVRQRVAVALDANSLFAPVGDTKLGLLWHYEELSSTPAPDGPNATGSLLGLAVLAVQALVLFVTFLLALPTGRARGRSTVARTGEAAPGFDEDENA